MPEPSRLLAFLSDHAAASAWSGDDWSLLFAEARTCGLLPRVAWQLAESDLAGSVPMEFYPLLAAARTQGAAVARDCRREIAHLRAALANIDTPVVLLKGAAYVLADLPAANGRTFSDIDLLVERPAIPRAESALMLAGWIADKKDAYDQRYYREWSHEIPPLTHLHRGTTVDLHHSLVMPTCRIKVDSAAMVARAVPLPGLPGWQRLADEDMVLHAAAHLMLNSEFDRGLRDLGDIDLLVRHFTASAAVFPQRLANRAREVGLFPLLACALGACKKIYRTPLSGELATAEGGVFLRWLIDRSATTRHPDARPSMQELSDLALAGRELALRLPPTLLIRHLWHKLQTGSLSGASSEQAAEQRLIP